MPRKVIVEAVERSPYGEEISPEFLTRPHVDVTAVPGYSDKRAAAEIAHRDGTPSAPLPCYLHWARAQGKGGESDLRKVAHWRSEGLEILTPTKAKELGLELDKSAAVQDGDAFRLNENILMFAPADVAAARYRGSRIANDAQFAERVQGPLEDAARAARARGVAGAVFEFAVEGKGLKPTKK